MLDKLIESGTDTRKNKGRSGYFAASTFLMSGILIVGLLISIFGANFDIGNGDLNVSQILAPVIVDAPEAEPPRENDPVPRDTRRASDLPMRTAAIQQISETPNKIVPVATGKIEFKERPDGRFTIGKFDLDPPGPATNSDESRSTGSGISRTGGFGESVAVVSDKTLAEPPPAIKRPESNRNTVVSLGPVNGKAVSLPKPAYPETAKAVRAEGSVQIQITIDRDGSVISAKALNGHPMLRRTAEEAARRARFTPTLLSNEPVRATGIITYNFQLN
ncbi:energy transducer TonB [Leptolyngbya sp. 7M]|uniref:energy transducer TonB n=1 Tax=Leptolyngbya sp. 7M TaxID=2812896 RepID=UPI001B8AED1D|nr:energy transducer TonB [Leptolyngbya sp. 7M]QYO66472.1 TonB family protein [Leptolyngbya sp. 7M]